MLLMKNILTLLRLTNTDMVMIRYPSIRYRVRNPKIKTLVIFS